MRVSGHASGAAGPLNVSPSARRCRFGTGLRRLGRAHAPAALGVLFLAWFAWGYSGSNARLLGPPLGEMSGQDFRQVLRASREVQEGRSPYRHAIAFGRAPSFREFMWWDAAPYPYPPVVAVLASPLLRVNENRALWWWTGVNVVLLVAGAVLAVATFGSIRGRRRLAAMAALAVFFLGYSPSQTELKLVQLDILILFLLIVTYWLYRRRHATAGLTLALAIVIKPLVLPMLGYFAWKRDWRTCVVAAGSAAALTAFGFSVAGWGVLPDYLEVNRLWTTGAMLDYPFNQSVHGVARRAFTQNTFIEPLVTAPFMVPLLAVAAAIAAVALWLLSVGRGDRRQDPVGGMEYGLTLLALMFLTPLVEDIHFVWALLPMSSLLLAVVAEGHERPASWVALGIVGCALYLAHPDLHDAIHLGWEAVVYEGRRVPASHLPLTAAYLYGLIALVALMAVHLRRLRGATPSAR